MKDKEPTKGEQREFWEWYGFEWWSIHRQGDLTDDARWEPLGGVEILMNDANGDMPYLRILRNNKWESAPSIDLNNLFKYVPRRITPRLWRTILHRWIADVTGDYEKDTLALFWVIRSLHAN